MTDRACLFGTYAREHSATRLLRTTLSAAGYAVGECHVPLWERTRDKAPAFFQAASLARRGLEYARALPRLVGMWRRVRRDVSLLVVGFNGQLDLLVARWLSRGRVPILFAPLVTLTETLVDDRRIYPAASPAARLARWLDRATLGGADLVLADTEAHRAYMCRTFDVDDARVQTVYLGAEESFYLASSAPDRPAPSVLFYGQYLPLHGIEAVVEAARRLAGRLPITLVGTGPLRGAMEQRAAGVAGLRFVDWVAYDALPAWIAAADICLGVFGTSGKAAMVIPNKVYQCAAGARPVVTGDTPAVREVFRHAENVWLVPPGDAGALADALARLADDWPLRRRLGDAAHALLRERFGLEAQGHRLRALIATATSRPR
jgi:glycosyltransferase involved in cell wall biosynthesis